MPIKDAVFRTYFGTGELVEVKLKFADGVAGAVGEFDSVVQFGNDLQERFDGKALLQVVAPQPLETKDLLLVGVSSGHRRIVLTCLNRIFIFRPSGFCGWVWWLGKRGAFLRQNRKLPKS